MPSVSTQTRIAYVWASSSDEDSQEDDEERGRRRNRRHEHTSLCVRLIHRLISLIRTLSRVVKSEEFKDKFCSWLREACLACLYFALLVVFVVKQY